MRDFLRSPLFAIFVIVFVDVLGVGITVPVLPLYAEDLGASATLVPMLASVYFFVQAFCSPLLGRTSDRFGRRPVLIFSQLGTLSAMLLSAWAPSLPWLFAARVLDGVTGGNITTAFAYVGDVSKPEQRARAMGVINAGFGAGFVLGPALGSQLSIHFGRRVPFLAAACVSLLTIALSIFRLKESRRPSEAPAGTRGPAAFDASSAAARPSFADIVKLPGVSRVLTIGFFMQIAMLAFTSMWVLWADRVGFVAYAPKEREAWIGWVFVFLGLCQLVTQGALVGPLVKKLGEKRMVTLGLFVRGFGWAAMAALPALVPARAAPLVFACLPLAAFGSGVATPALMAILTFAVPAARRGQAIGVMAAVEGTGRILGPLLAGVLFEKVSYGSPIITAGVLSMLTAGLALTLTVNKPGAVAAPRVAEAA